MLPESLQAIADLIGTPAALKIAERWGGTRLYIPEDPGEDHELAKLIGIEAARALGDEYAGERIEIPKADCWGRAVRDSLIREARTNGQSQASLALEYRLTERQVRNIERQIVDDSQAGFEF